MILEMLQMLSFQHHKLITRCSLTKYVASYVFYFGEPCRIFITPFLQAYTRLGEGLDNVGLLTKLNKGSDS